MPVYEYECAACGHRFEEFQKITDKPLKTCPSCKKRKVHRLISQTSFVLKGSGWYVTDYGKADKRPAGKPAKKDKETSDSSSSATAKEPKPEPPRSEPPRPAATT